MIHVDCAGEGCAECGWTGDLVQPQSLFSSPLVTTTSTPYHATMATTNLQSEAERTGDPAFVILLGEANSLLEELNCEIPLVYNPKFHRILLCDGAVLFGEEGAWFECNHHMKKWRLATWFINERAAGKRPILNEDQDI